MLLSFEIAIEGAFIVVAVGAEVLDTIWLVTRTPTGVDGTCADRYGGYTGTWENLLSPAEKWAGTPCKESPGLLEFIATEGSEAQLTVGTTERRKRSAGGWVAEVGAR